MNRAAIEYRSPANLVPYARNARTHSRKQIRQIADSIEHFGFTNPVLIGDDDTIIAGHGRVQAAKLLRLKEVPTIRLSGMSEADRRAYVLADNKLALNAGWDMELQALELQALIDLSFDVELTGFSVAEVDLCFDTVACSDPGAADKPEDRIPPQSRVPVSRPGDVWLCGRHRLICGDARDESILSSLMGDERADMMFTDPPYNVAIDGHVCGSGSVRHREFAFASGEMDKSEFIAFLLGTLGPASSVLRDGAIAYVCMDWRHMDELLTVGSLVFTELKNLIVWNKTNGGMGAFYRSKHELIFAFKKGKAAHTNNFGLGDTGRYRTNVWDYPGISSIGADRDASLAMHPTVKPVALVADAIRDCSKRGQIVLDCFGGSGTTLIAAETTGRSARLIEYDAVYCDTIMRRWEGLTGKSAHLASTDSAFEDIEVERSLPDSRDRNRAVG